MGVPSSSTTLPSLWRKRLTCPLLSVATSTLASRPPLAVSFSSSEESLSARCRSSRRRLRSSARAPSLSLSTWTPRRTSASVVTIKCTTKEFFTDQYHYSVIDAPGHRDFIKNMISGAAQADVGVLMVPADGNFVTAIQKGDHKAGEVQGQTRQHARLINLLGVKQLIVCINKMDAAPTACYKKDRYDEIAGEMKLMLVKVGWPKQFVEKRVPVIPISGWCGDNLLTKSTNMPWWEGMKVKISKEKAVHVNTLLDGLETFVQPAKRDLALAMRLPLSGVYKIKGVGDVLTGRVEQGAVKPGEEVKFLPTHTDSTSCTGKVFTVEMHHKRIDHGSAGDNIGMNVKALNKENMPRVGDVMVYKSDGALATTKNFAAQVQILDIPGEISAATPPLVTCAAGVLHAVS